jgi:hypothetical protein
MVVAEGSLTISTPPLLLLTSSDFASAAVAASAPSAVAAFTRQADSVDAARRAPITVTNEAILE